MHRAHLLEEDTSGQPPGGTSRARRSERKSQVRLTSKLSRRAHSNIPSLMFLGSVGSNALLGGPSDFAWLLGLTTGLYRPAVFDSSILVGLTAVYVNPNFLAILRQKHRFVAHRKLFFTVRAALHL